MVQMVWVLVRILTVVLGNRFSERKNSACLFTTTLTSNTSWNTSDYQITWGFFSIDQFSDTPWVAYSLTQF